MNGDYTKDISRYLDLYARLNGSVGDKDIALEILRQLGKDSRFRAIRESESRKNGGGSNDVEATPRQRAFLEARGIATEGMSKQAASAAIDRIKAEEAR